jgi:hypothetical protein
MDRTQVEVEVEVDVTEGSMQRRGNRRDALRALAGVAGALLLTAASGPLGAAGSASARGGERTRSTRNRALRGQQTPRRGRRQRRPGTRRGDVRRNQAAEPNPGLQQTGPRELPGGRLRGTPGPVGPLTAEDRYIVRLRDEVADVARVAEEIAAAAPGVVVTHVYTHVFAGFAALIPAAQLEAVSNDPQVFAVVADGIVTVTGRELRTHGDPPEAFDRRNG